MFKLFKETVDIGELVIAEAVEGVFDVFVCDGDFVFVGDGEGADFDVGFGVGRLELSRELEFVSLKS